MKNKKAGPRVFGLPSHLSKYKLAYFCYSATGEGITIEAQIVDGDSEPAVGWENFRPKLIPAVIEKEFIEQKYLDWNPEFKYLFYESFGIGMWEHFLNCSMNNNKIDLIVKMHYNLS